jgi:hypothetical protein
MNAAIAVATAELRIRLDRLERETARPMPTLTQSFADAGYAIVAPAREHAGYRLVVRDGRIVAKSYALGDSPSRRNGWTWLARRARKLASLRGSR